MTDRKMQQEVSTRLTDVKRNGKIRDWDGKKARNMLLADAYEEIDVHKADRLRNCAEFLQFTTQPDGRKRLSAANFCRLRLCPICQWRKSLKAQGQMRKILAWVNEREDVSYVFVTLTVRNCTLADLPATLDNMMKAWDRLMQITPIRGKKGCKPPVMGWYRSLEITHDVDEFLSRRRYEGNPKYYQSLGLKPGDKNPGFNTYHPHFHAIWAVSPSYFGKQYISQADLTQFWQRAARLPYTPIVNIKRVRGKSTQDITSAGNQSLRAVNLAGAICEITKYATKDADYLIAHDWDLTIESIKGIDAALERRRLIARGGIFAEAFRQLKLEEPEDGDLVHVDDDGIMDKLMAKVVFVWHSGYSRYCKE